jgi:hypothetical protein
MNCFEVRSRLDDHLDGRLASDEQHRVRDHLEECSDCAGLERSLRAVEQEVGELPDALAPGRDLWSGIEERLDSIAVARSETGRSRMVAWSGWIAASVLVALLGGTWLVREVTTGGGAGTDVAATAPAASSNHTTTTAIDTELAADTPARREIEAIEAQFVQAKEQLHRVLDEQREMLSPRTAEMVDDNLAIIEKAIQEIGDALERDPANRKLNRMLMAAHQRELDLLQHVTQRASRL